MRSLKILQYNVQKSKDKVLIPLFKDEKTREFDIIAVQEPWRNPSQPTTYNRRNGDFHLAFPPQGGRACFYINKKLDLNYWSVTFTSPDMCSLKIRIDDNDIWVHNLYSEPPGGLQVVNFNSPIPLLNQALSQLGEHILVGDFNLHHPIWGGIQDPIQHEAASHLIASVERANLQLFTPPGITTWEARGSRSTLDLAFGSPWVFNRLLNCCIRTDLDHGSDHIPIEVSLALEPVIAPIMKKRKWKTLNKEMVAAGAEELHQPTISTLSAANIERYTSYLMDFIQELIELTVPWAKPSRRATPWWTQEIQALVTQERQLRRQYLHTGDEQVAHQRITVGVQKRKQIAWEKRKAFRKDVHDAANSPEGVWRLTKWARTKSDQPAELPVMPALRTLTGLATTFEEKVLALSQRFYPDSTADLSDIEDSTFEDNTFLPNWLPMEQTVTESEMTSIIHRQATGKAPGRDGIPTEFLKAMGQPFAKALASLTTSCWRAGYYPIRFREAQTIVLKKPGKAAYNEAGA